jgi:hypothetical protein
MGNRSIPLQQRFPDKTRKVDELLFSAKIKTLSSEILFSVLDFSGETLWSSIGRGAEHHKKPLQQALSSCHAHIVLLRADYMADEDIEQCRRMSGGYEIYQILLEALEDRTGKERMRAGHPIVFGLTQVDRLFDSAATARTNLELAVKNTRQLFRKFFDGSGRYYSCVTALTMGERIQQKGPFKPKNVTLPFDFCLGVCLSGASQYENNRAISLYSDRNQVQQKIRSRKQLNWFERVWERIESGEPLDGMLAEEARLESIEQQHSEKHRVIFSMGKEIWNGIERQPFVEGMAAIYSNGQRYIPAHIENISDTLLSPEAK